MIITVTANTAMDHIVFIEEWHLNQTLRAHKTIHSMAGKPTDASWILSEIKMDSLALGFKAGITGETIQQMLEIKGVKTDFIPVNGESRRNIVIVMNGGQQQTTITSSTLYVSASHIDQLEMKYSAALDGASCVVIGGTLPEGVPTSFYTRFIHLARQRSIPVIFDASGKFLEAGLQGQPTYIKPNRDELAELLQRPIDSIEDAYWAGHEIRNRFGVYPIISMGEAGGLAILPEQIYRIHPLRVKVANTAGAGDGILAGLAAAIERNQPVVEGLRLGFAAATAIVTQPGTAQCSAEDIHLYQEQIKIEVFDVQDLEKKPNDII